MKDVVFLNIACNDALRTYVPLYPSIWTPQYADIHRILIVSGKPFLIRQDASLTI
jgi:hypothetical protein